MKLKIIYLMFVAGCMAALTCKLIVDYVAVGGGVIGSALIALLMAKVTAWFLSL